MLSQFKKLTEAESPAFAEWIDPFLAYLAMIPTLVRKSTRRRSPAFGDAGLLHIHRNSDCCVLLPEHKGRQQIC